MRCGQVGGLIGGVKLGVSGRGTPVTVSSYKLPLSQQFIRTLSTHLLLLYTGKVSIIYVGYLQIYFVATLCYIQQHPQQCFSFSMDPVVRKVVFPIVLCFVMIQSVCSVKEEWKSSVIHRSFFVTGALGKELTTDCDQELVCPGPNYYIMLCWVTTIGCEGSWCYA